MNPGTTVGTKKPSERPTANADSGEHASSFPPDLGLLIVLPDAIRQELVEGIGDYLSKLGVYVVAAMPEMLTVDHVAALYPGGPTAKASANGRMHGRAMTTGLLEIDNSLVVLVGRAGTDRSGNQDLSTLLHDCKGPSSYLQRRPGSLRELSALADRCMSLIHTPDNGEEAARDAALFYPGLEVDRLSAWRGGRRLDWQVVKLCRAWHPYGPNDSRYAIAVRTALRCVASFLAMPEEPGILDQAQFWRMYDACLEWLGQEPLGPHAEHERYLDLCSTLRQRLPELGNRYAAPFFTATSDLLDLLTNPEMLDHGNGLKVLSLLRDVRFALSDFESHHLLTLMTFFND